MKKNYILNIILVLSIIGCIISVFFFSDPSVIASALEPPSDTVVLRGSTYDSSNDFCNTLDSIGGSVPAGYNLVAVLIQPSVLTSNQTSVKYYYAPSNFEYLTAYVDKFGLLHLSKSPNTTSFYYVHNRFNSSHNQNLVTNGYGNSSGTTSSDTGWLFFSFINVLDENGDPTYAPSRIPFNLNVLTVDSTIFMNSTLDDSGARLFTTDYYVFPSTFPLTSNPTTLISTTPVTSLTDTDKNYLIDRAFSWWLSKFPFGNDRTDIPIVQNFSSVFASALSSFNPDLYNLPYSHLGTLPTYVYGTSSSTDLGNALSVDLRYVHRSGVWSNSNLCIVAVCRHDNLVSFARYDFNIDSILNGSVVPPQFIEGGISYNNPSLNDTDLNELAQYLKYLAQTMDHNRGVDSKNIISYMNAMPWTNIFAGGIFNGQLQFLPHLSAEFDTIFNGLFDKYFVPDLTAIEMQIDADELAFAQKFAWVHQVKSEVNFIITTPLTSSGDVQYTIDSIEDLGVEESIVIFDTNWFDDYKSIIRTVFDVFGTIALVMYIFKTLPSTLGNMPSD